MSDFEKLVHGIDLSQWAASFRPGMPEFAASRFTFSFESTDMVRIAFGNSGPFVNEAGGRAPVFTHAVTLSPETAVELARLLLKAYAEPVASRSKSSCEL